MADVAVRELHAPLRYISLAFVQDVASLVMHSMLQIPLSVNRVAPNCWAGACERFMVHAGHEWHTWTCHNAHVTKRYS